MFISRKNICFPCQQFLQINTAQISFEAFFAKIWETVSKYLKKLCKYIQFLIVCLENIHCNFNGIHEQTNHNNFAMSMRSSKMQTRVVTHVSRIHPGTPWQ